MCCHNYFGAGCLFHGVKNVYPNFIVAAHLNRVISDGVYEVYQINIRKQNRQSHLNAFTYQRRVGKRVPWVHNVNDHLDDEVSEEHHQKDENNGAHDTTPSKDRGYEDQLPRNHAANQKPYHDVNSDISRLERDNAAKLSTNAHQNSAQCNKNSAE